MEDAVSVGAYIPRTPWYRKGWGEALLVIFSLLVIGVGLFIGGVATEVRRMMLTQTVDDVAGEGTISLSTNIKPVSDTSGINMIPNSAMVLGSPDAQLTIIEFADFGCPYSLDTSHTMRELSAKYPKRFQYIFRDFPNTDLHPDAENAANAARCAAEKGKFWAYHDKLFANQGAQDQLSLVRYATEIGLEAEPFAICLGSKKYSREVQADFEAGVQAGIRGTPTFFLNGHRAEGPLPADKLEALLLKFPER